MPEMSVVRFNESDVIVASLYMQGWSDNQALNGTARTKPDGEILASNQRGEIDGYFGNTTFYFAPDKPVDIGTLINDDRISTPISGFDGWYVQNVDGNWERQ